MYYLLLRRSKRQKRASYPKEYKATPAPGSSGDRKTIRPIPRGPAHKGSCIRRNGRFPGLRIVTKGRLPSFRQWHSMAFCSPLTVTRSRGIHTRFPFTLLHALSRTEAPLALFSCRCDCYFKHIIDPSASSCNTFFRAETVLERNATDNGRRYPHAVQRKIRTSLSLGRSGPDYSVYCHIRTGTKRAPCRFCRLPAAAFFPESGFRRAPCSCGRSPG